jgi:ABC-type oligopeptide transport system substrate-binding subunit
MRTLKFPIRDIPDQLLVAPLLQAAIKQHLGCDMDTYVLQSSKYLEVVNDQGDFDFTGNWWGGGTLANYIAFASALKCGMIDNIARYCNPEYDKLADEFNVALEPAVRMETALEIRDLLDNDMPLLTLGGSRVYWAWWNDYKGFPPGNVMGHEKSHHRMDLNWYDPTHQWIR